MNLETRIAERTKSVFTALGQIISDFYLEAGIYCVSGLNAVLVAWGIYTDLVAGGQPLAYAIGIGVIALVAVEGLAVYLVGAAARTRNNLLWFFSIAFATFFTWAHIQEMITPGVIAQYVTVAIPFFVVIGYWARTVKMDTEAEDEATAATQLKAEELQREVEERERLRQEKLDDDARLREQQIADETRRYEQEQDRLEAERKHEIKVSKLAQSEVSKKVPNTGVKDGEFNVFTPNLDTHNTRQKLTKTDRILHLQSLIASDPNQSNSQLATRLGVSRQTIINYKKTLEPETNGVAK